MNAYFVHAGNMNVVVDRIEHMPIHANEFMCDLVFAETRGKAKHIFLKHYDGIDCPLDFIDVKSCRLVEKDVKRKVGIAAHDDPLWENIPFIFDSKTGKTIKLEEQING